MGWQLSVLWELQGPRRALASVFGRRAIAAQPPEEGLRPAGRRLLRGRLLDFDLIGLWESPVFAELERGTAPI